MTAPDWFAFGVSVGLGVALAALVLGVSVGSRVGAERNKPGLWARFRASELPMLLFVAVVIAACIIAARYGAAGERP